MLGLALVVLKNRVCGLLVVVKVVPGGTWENEIKGGSFRHEMMSLRTRDMAVAVRAMMGTEGTMRFSLSQLSCL